MNIRQINAKLLVLEQAQKNPEYRGIIKGAYNELMADIKLIYKDVDAKRLKMPKNAKEAKALAKAVEKFDRNYMKPKEYKARKSEQIAESLNSKMGTELTGEQLDRYAEKLIFGQLSDMVGYRKVLRLIKNIGFDKFKDASNSKKKAQALLDDIAELDAADKAVVNEMINLRDKKLEERYNL